MHEQIAYKSNRNIYYSCKYHVVFYPKYRGKVLIEGRAERFKQIIVEVCQEHQAEVLKLEVMSDQLHLLAECNPQFGIHPLARLMKTRSSLFSGPHSPALTRKVPTPRSERPFWFSI